MINYSFIIPHKNCPEMLKRCVDSIPARDDVQIIIVDDNSDEGKKPALSEQKGLIIVLLDASQSKGAGRARNIGMEKAEGKWLLFPDCDDYYNPNLLKILDRYVESDKDIIYLNFEHRDGVTNELLPPLSYGKYFDEYDGSEKSKEEIRLHHNVPWTKMISRSYILHYQFQFEEVIIGNDMLFSMLVGYFTNKIEVEKTPLYVYLRNGNSITTKKLTDEASLCVITHIIKLNNFYSFINHPEWRVSTVDKIFRRVLKAGPSLAILLLRKSLYLFRHRNDWVVLFNEIALK